MSFSKLGLSEPLLQTLNQLRFVKPTPVQEQSIPLMLEGKNVVGQAQTGSGKTLAFAIPILERISSSEKKTQALVVAPTRELVLQISKVFWEIRGGGSDTRVTPVYGGASKDDQRSSLNQGSQVIVATPGRLIDFIWEGAVNLESVQIVILDEADRMLEMGFIDDVDFILSCMPQKKQIALFSATLPPPIQKILHAYVPHPAHIRLETLVEDRPNIQQKFYHVEARDKVRKLLRLLEGEDESTLVFCRTRGGADKLSRALVNAGHLAAVIHGGKDQGERDRVMRKFRKGSLHILVATDLASRGLDIDRVSRVVNYDVPMEPEDYVHRIGRTGRAGRAGSAITLVTPMEKRQVHDIEKLVGRPAKFAAS